MEGLQKTVVHTSKDSASSSSSSSSSLSADQSKLVFARTSGGGVVSYLTCSKLCAFCFVAGIVVGYTLKRTVRRWASSLLKKIRDD